MTRVRVSKVAPCSKDDPRTNVIANAPQLVVLYIGVSENARSEEKQLEAGIKACNGKLRIEMVDFLADKTLNGFDLATEGGVVSFSESLGEAGHAVREMLLAEIYMPDVIDLRWHSARKRTFWARVAWTFHEAQLRQTRLERLVLSGHHLPDGDSLFGDTMRGGGDNKLRYETLRGLISHFPAAAEQVRHLMLSACRSLGGTNALILRRAFPRLQSVWGYVGASPDGSEEGGGQTSSEHILAWLAASQGDARTLTVAANELRNAMVLRGRDIYRLHKFSRDLRR